jgi:hypothetical protein
MEPKFLLSISVAIATFLAGWALHKLGTMQEKRKELELKESAIPQDQTIQEFINKRWDIQYKMRECKDVTSLENIISADFVEMEQHYEDIISSQLFNKTMNELTHYFVLRQRELTSENNNS